MPCALSASVYRHWKDVPTHECPSATVTADVDCLSSPRNPHAGAVGPLKSHGIPLRADPASRRAQADLRSSDTLAEEGKGESDVT